MDVMDIEDNNQLLPDIILDENLSDVPIEFDSDSDYSDSEDDASSTPETEDDNMGWVQDDEVPRNIEPFLGSPGVKIHPINTTIKEVVNLFLSDELFKFIAEETNRYHEQVMMSRNKPVTWRPVRPIEIKKVFALFILTAIEERDSIEEYWSNTQLFFDNPVFRTTMSLSRFLQIWKYLHFSNNNDNTCGNDRYHKIKKLMDFFHDKFENVYKPRRELALNEFIISWKEKLAFRYYSVEDSAKRGILIRMLIESDTGYCTNVEVYPKNSGNLADAIIPLMGQNVNKWHHLYIDSYQNSVRLAEILLQNNTRMCGELRPKQELPRGRRNQILKQGQSLMICQRKNQVLISLWVYKKIMKMISTIHKSSIVRMDNGNLDVINLPECVYDYIKYAKNIQHISRYLAFLTIMAKTKKWYKKVALFVMGIALSNAYYVFKNLNPTIKIKRREFRMKIANIWLSEVDPEARTSRQSSSKLKKRSRKLKRLRCHKRLHVLEEIPSINRRRYSMRRCHVCITHNIRSDTRYRCKLCLVPLHRVKCFRKFHTERKY